MKSEKGKASDLLSAFHFSFFIINYHETTR
ncbi:hypothetical protein EV202_12611 [Bacteroides heparinolyticus]|uniref:Uncharacterized protein n=1 Tax=Prevotella heparinolytica TaxID=28113 RepID=A0A449I4X0_9BACE|nr:hypothetical protein EV202_12611 [Bacteroides heparinolyticus]VFB14470.1 Uncharacterised protein [Bacteroides heparinolyticus]